MSSGMETPNGVSSDSEKLETGSQPTEKEFERPIRGMKWFLICCGMYLAAVLYGLDTTIAADVQGSIVASLGEIDKLVWVGVGFPMGSVATILLIGVLYGLFEIKWLILASIALFEVGSAICGSAPTMDVLVVGRVVAGVGGAGMYLGALNYISSFTTIRERPIYMALIGLSWGLGCILGPVVGGAFSASSATWRWAFYINLVLAGVTAPIYIGLFPKKQPRPDLTFGEKMRRIDFLGALLIAAVFVIFLVVLSLAGVTYAWNSGTVIALWVVLGVVLISFMVQQGYPILTTTENRIYPVQFLKRRSMVLLYIGTACAATGLFVPTYFIPLFFQFTHGDSAIEAAVRLLPSISVGVAFTMLSGALLPVIRYYAPFYLASGIFLIIGGALAMTITASTPVSTIYGYTVLMAIGAGLGGQAAYTVGATKLSKTPHQVPQAMGFLNVGQLGSIAIALGIAGSVFQNTGLANLRAALPLVYSDADLRGALSGAQSALLQTAPPEIRQMAIDAIVKTISRLYALVLAAGVLQTLAALAMRWEKMELSMMVAA